MLMIKSIVVILCIFLTKFVLCKIKNENVLWSDDWSLSQVETVFNKRKGNGIPLSQKEEKFESELKFKKRKEKLKTHITNVKRKHLKNLPKRKRSTVCLGNECVIEGKFNFFLISILYIICI